MKNIVIILGVLCTSIGFSQETSSVFESQDYKELKKFYENSLSSNLHTDRNALEKEFIEKIGVENFNSIQNSSITIEDWLQEHWTKTSFLSLEEAYQLLERKTEVTKQISESTKEILPLFTKLSKEVGREVLFKKLNDDLKQDVLNTI